MGSWKKALWCVSITPAPFLPALYFIVIINIIFYELLKKYNVYDDLVWWCKRFSCFIRTPKNQHFLSFFWVVSFVTILIRGFPWVYFTSTKSYLQFNSTIRTRRRYMVIWEAEAFTFFYWISRVIVVKAKIYELIKIQHKSSFSFFLDLFLYFACC